MENLINKIPEQFKFVPEVANGGALEKGKYDYFIVGGMGGSHLAADMINAVIEDGNIFIHRDYGLPKLPSEIVNNALHIAVSYSGNTEETLDFASQTLAALRPLAAVTTGGRLLSFARGHKIPHVVMPEVENLQPRMATGFMMAALVSLMGKTGEFSQTQSFAATLRRAIPELECLSHNIADKIGNRIPLFYASERNRPLADYQKIIVNETAKVPAFSNAFPELNHNEMNAFAANESLHKFIFVLMHDGDDHPRVIRRLSVFGDVVLKRGGEVLKLDLAGKTRLEKIMNHIFLSHLVAVTMALYSGVEPMKVPMVEEFKKLIA